MKRLKNYFYFFFFFLTPKKKKNHQTEGNPKVVQLLLRALVEAGWHIHAYTHKNPCNSQHFFFFQVNFSSILK